MKEQGHVCAYCMRRIKISDNTTTETTRIEHILSRENHKNKQLDYNNMVLCCNGEINNSYHCDKSKGSKDISFDIFNDSFFDTISYKSKDGAIISSNKTYNNEINKILNLNNKLLKANRLSALNGVIGYLTQKGWRLSDIKTQINKWENKNSDGKYKEYSGIVLCFLNKKLQHKL